MSRTDETATVESAVKQLEAAIGHEVTGVSMNLAEGKIEMLLGETESVDITIEDGDDEVIEDNFEDKSWNDLVSLAANTEGVGYDGESRDELEAKLRGVDLGEIEDDDDDSHEVTIESLAEQVTSGDLEMKDAKKKASEAGLEVPLLFEEVNGECQSQRDCGHGARDPEAVYCFSCEKSKALPKLDAFGITGEEAAAAVSLWETDNYDSLEEAIEVVN